MTADPFADAEALAIQRARWREYAAGPCITYSRRQALARARKCENRIIDIAIQCEARGSVETLARSQISESTS